MSLRKRLVVVGSGWGGFSLLKSINKNLYDVSVVSLRNHFLFTPLLASTTVGTLEFRSIIEPVRVTNFRNESDFHLSKVVSVDTASRKIKCQSALDDELQYDLNYDRLVLAVGARANTFGLPGVAEHAYFLKEVHHARAIRERIMGNLELAVEPKLPPHKRKELLTFVVVGGGPTGVEFCAELYDFLVEDVSRYYPKESQEISMKLIEGRGILASFDEKLRVFALKKIAARPQMTLISHNVTEVKKNSIVLDTGEEIPCGLVVWSAGIGPQPLALDLPWAKNKNHQILVDPYLRVKGLEDVYAIGDCAAVEGYPLPATAQVAETQGYYLAKELGEKPLREPYKFKSKGLLAYLGGYEALAQFSPVELGIGNSKSGGVKAWTPATNVKGWLSWVIWRSAYLTKLGSWRLRMQVPMDWFKTFFMGRDISRF